MKFRFKFNRRHNIYFTLAACGTGIWLMVVRFGLNVETLVSFAIISVCMLIVIIGVAALFAYIIRFIKDRE